MTIPVNKIEYGSALRREFLHMTGGLRATRSDGGWLIGPLRSPKGAQRFGPVRDELIGSICKELGVIVFGADEITEKERRLPTRVWTPLLGVPLLRHQPADTWALIARAARLKNDIDYAKIAANISFSLRAAGMRLRDASDEYHRQLLAALERGQPGSLRFKNVAMLDLHLAFHSLLAELASTRDYLATFAARRIGAPNRIDALNRLIDWLEKSDDSIKSDPIALALDRAYNTEGEDPWLFDLSEYRNLFLHREPIGTNEHAQWLTTKEHANVHGVALLIEMLVPASSKSTTTCEALVRFIELHAKMCRLADFVASFSLYKAEPIQIEVNRKEARRAD